jgi:hypothetical protein
MYPEDRYCFLLVSKFIIIVAFVWVVLAVIA